MIKPFYKCTPFNFVPLVRTPWAGQQISYLKRKNFPQYENKIPKFIGESWEVSTDMQFPSQVEVGENKEMNLLELGAINSNAILGQENFNKYGVHFPLLLKWLEANDLLSVQLHPDNLNINLKENECGKPEAWLVLNAKENSFVYLGFKENMSKDDILTCLKNDELEQCLHKYKPNKFDYISVPPGCVHAIGPGVLVAEPQYVLPKKIAKTWRISDWKRLYDEQGKLSPNGKPRELHMQESLSSINWNLPKGAQLERALIQNIKSNQPFLGDENNPFALKIFSTSALSADEYKYNHLVPGTFSLFTVWSGKVTLACGHDTLHLQGGESGFICAQSNDVQVILERSEEDTNIAFFALNDVYC